MAIGDFSVVDIRNLEGIMIIVALHFNLWHSMISLTLNRILFLNIRVTIYDEELILNLYVLVKGLLMLYITTFITHAFIKYTGYLFVELDMSRKESD